jgi:ferredoxin
MHHELTKALWDFYPPEDKNDFFPAYVYLRHMERFMYYALLKSGLLPKEPKEKCDEDVDEMIKHHVERIAETSLSFDTSIYHGKVVSLRDAMKLVTLKKDLKLSPPERVIPFKVARDVIVGANDTIAVGPCACRANVENPCLPPTREICLYLGDPFASFIAEASPNHRKISQDEAVKVLEFAHSKGLVHSVWFKKETGNRQRGICNCCSCCCLGVKMWNQLEGMVPIIAGSGYVAEVSDDCNGCAACADSTCHFKAIRMSEDGQKVVINEANCMGCGVCVDVCPVEAIRLRREPSKGDPLDIDELQTQAQKV